MLRKGQCDVRIHKLWVCGEGVVSSGGLGKLSKYVYKAVEVIYANIVGFLHKEDNTRDGKQ